MSDSLETVLVIETDPELRAILRDEICAACRLHTLEAQDGPEGLALFQQYWPDLVVLDLVLPGLSGRDLLVAFRAQGYRGPLIVLGDPGRERAAVDAFRLGATDFIAKPLREAEALAALERALVEARLRRHRDGLLAQLQQVDADLEARRYELEVLYAIGQMAAAMREPERLFAHVLEGAVLVTGADHSMLLLREDRNGQLILRAGKNMRLAMLDRLGDPVQDPLADLVMKSREALTVSGDGLRRFTTARELIAVAYVPLIVQARPIGVLMVGNHQTQAAFNDHHVRLLRLLADTTAVAAVNARLFGLLDQRNRALDSLTRGVRERDAQHARQIQALLTRLHPPLNVLESELARLAAGEGGKIPHYVSERLAALSRQAKQLAALVGGLSQRQGS